MSISVKINDPLQILSKTQKEKIKSHFKQNMKEEEILSKIYYTSELKYNSLNVANQGNVSILDFSVKEVQREILRKKLQQKIKSKGRVNDPCWAAYFNLKKHGAVLANNEEIPDPDFIKENKELFNTQLDIFKSSENVFIKYIKMCLEKS